LHQDDLEILLHAEKVHENKNEETPHTEIYKPIHYEIQKTYLSGARPCLLTAHHKYSHIFLAQILSLCPPTKTRTQIDVFYTHAEIDTKHLPLAPRYSAGVDPLSANWDNKQNKNAFFLVIPPLIYKHMRESTQKFIQSLSRGVLLITNELSNELIRSQTTHQPNLTLNFHKQGLQALYFDNHETLPTTKTTLSSELTTTSHPEIVLEATRPIESIYNWTNISLFTPKPIHELIHRVICGFILGRTLRFKGMRDSKTECKNYQMTEAEIDFVRKDNIKSTQKRHIQNLQTRTNPFLNGVVNPVFVRQGKKMRKIVDHTKSGNNIYIHKQQQTNSSPQTIIDTVRKLGPNCLFIVTVFYSESAYKQINTSMRVAFESRERPCE
jgi:hypothetical protein